MAGTRYCRAIWYTVALSWVKISTRSRRCFSSRKSSRRRQRQPPLLAPRLEGAAALARAARLLDEALHTLRAGHADALLLAELSVMVARLLVQRRLLLRQLDVQPLGLVLRQKVAAQLL